MSHEAAARLHGFDRALSDAVEFTVPQLHAAPDPGFASTPPSSSPWTAPVSMASRARPPPARSWTSPMPCIAPVRLEAAIDSAIRSGATARSGGRATEPVACGPGRRGVLLLDELVRDSGGHSPLERRFLGLVREAGLPRPRTQVVHTPGRAHLRPRRLPVRAAGRRRRGVRAPRARQRCRAGARRAAPQRAPGRRPRRLRVDVPGGLRRARASGRQPARATRVEIGVGRFTLISTTPAERSIAPYDAAVSDPLPPPSAPGSPTPPDQPAWGRPAQPTEGGWAQPSANRHRRGASNNSRR